MSKNIRLEAKLMNAKFDGEGFYEPFIYIGNDRIRQEIDKDSKVVFVVERYEYSKDGEDYFSTVDGFDDLIVAIKLIS